MNLSRRSLLKLGAVGVGAGAAGLVLPLGQSASTADWASTLPPSRMPKPYAARLRRSPALPYREMVDGDGPYRLYTVTQTSGQLNVIDGLPTPAYGYGYRDVSGNQHFSVPGPVVSVPRGTRVKLRVKNELPATHAQWGYEMSTSTHLHGSASLPQYDGYADDLTRPGQYKDYWYPNFQQAKTLWYHDHGVHHTSRAVYSGLAAQYHLHDDAERALLPQGQYDVPLTISDALFDTAGRLVYQDNQFSGVWGDVILVNGSPWPFMEVQRRVYRFRILLATLSRSMNLRLVNVQTRQAVPVHVVATDGGLMPTSQQVTSWRHAGAERYEVLVDFGAFGSLPAGSTFELRNTSASNNRDYLHTGKVMQFRLSDVPVEDTRNNSIPGALVSSTVMQLSTGQATRTRRMDLKHDDRTNLFTIDDRTWRDVQDSRYQLLIDGANPAVGAVEIWEIENKSGGWFHPLHMHLVDFRILSRRGGSGRVEAWERGAKDVVHVGEGEIVRLITKYEMPPGAAGAAGGKYMIHCHNLPHEDNDMMGQFQVGGSPGVNDPLTAAPAQPIPPGGEYSDGPEQLADKV
jgi:FtsP/CotA-like multicopper oxidase with cupredoxin domain